MKYKNLRNELDTISNHFTKPWKVILPDSTNDPGPLSEEKFTGNQDKMIADLEPGEEIYSVLYGHFSKSKTGEMLIQKRFDYNPMYGLSL